MKPFKALRFLRNLRLVFLANRISVVIVLIAFFYFVAQGIMAVLPNMQKLGERNEVAHEILGIDPE